jgi:hypothetical protein
MISKIQIDIWKTKASIFGKNIHYLKIGQSGGRVTARVGIEYSQSENIN